MFNLDKKGYHISIKGWSGHFGNNLIQLSSAINLAIATESLLDFPDHDYLLDSPFDFTNSKNTNCGEKVEGIFFYTGECYQYPLIYDNERRRIGIRYIIPLLKNKIESYQFEIGASTLVINIRSGDLFRKDYKSKEAIQSGIRGYVQPPLSFYKKIILENDYRDILIVTQPDLKNPTISALINWRNDIKIKKHINPLDDFLTLMSAKNLITAHSTFSWMSALFSESLKNLYLANTFQMNGIQDFQIHRYDFQDYIKIGKWEPSRKNLKRMLNYPMHKIKTLDNSPYQNSKSTLAISKKNHFEPLKKFSTLVRQRYLKFYIKTRIKLGAIKQLLIKVTFPF